MVSNRAFRNGASILNIGIATFIEDNVYTFMMDTNLLDQLYRILSTGEEENFILVLLYKYLA